MELQVLVSTMHQENYSLLEKMHVESNAIVINQCDKIGTIYLDFKGKEIEWINKKDRGLSKSRNSALKHATSEICVLADDDLEYVENYNDLIIEQFKLNPKADIITFKVEGIEKKFKNYHLKPRKLNYITSMKVSSVEIAFKLESIKKANIRFDELFGAGSQYCMSEENIFLTECLRKGLNIYYIPLKIADLHIGESTWFKGYNKEYFFSKGAAFTAMSRILSRLYILQYILRKYKIYKEDITLIDAIKQMRNGRRDYINKLKDKTGDIHEINS